MTDSNVIILPVIRRLNSGSVVTRQVVMDWPVDDKIRVAAKMARCSPEQLIEALIVYGLAAIDKKPVEAFILAAEVEVAKAKDMGDRTEPHTSERLPELNLSLP